MQYLVFGTDGSITYEIGFGTGSAKEIDLSQLSTLAVS
jgi:hypothetical protein